jgi:hypothetical protein
LRKERWLRVFENRALRTKFGPKRDEGTRDRRELHNEELNYMYCSHRIVWVNKSRMIQTRHVARMGERRGA